MKNFNVTSMLVMLMFMCITSMQAQNTILEKVLQDLEKIAPVKFEYDEVRKEVTVRMKQDGKK